jgi:hypothetical protein
VGRTEVDIVRCFPIERVREERGTSAWRYSRDELRHRKRSRASVQDGVGWDGMGQRGSHQWGQNGEP